VGVPRGTDVEDLSVVVFSTDRTQWNDFGENPRTLKIVSVDRGVRYAVRDLPPGDYFAAAVAGPPPVLEPATFESLARRAVRVRIDGKLEKVQDLRLADRAPDPAPDVDREADRPRGPFVHGGPQTPTIRDTTASAPSGTGVIAGVATSDGDRPQPLRRVAVTLSGAASFGSRIVLTDETGRFVFTGLPAGRFTLRASKAAYLVQNYGATRPGGPGLTIALAEGQQLTEMTIPLSRGGIVTGFVRDDRGQPAPGVSIRAFRLQQTAAGPRQYSGGTAQTDDRGQYRIFGIAPGEYFIVAAPRFGSGVPTQKDDLELASGSSPARTGSTQAVAAPAHRPAVGVANVYFPGTTLLDGAQTVSIGVGEERTGVDMALQLVPTVWVEGTVSNPGGALPANLSVHLAPIRAAEIGDDPFSMLPKRPQPDGRFSFSGVAPGLYVVAVVTEAMGRGRGAAPGDAGLWATAEVQVNGIDVTGVALSLQPAMTISGRVAFDGAGPPPLPTSVRVSLTPILTGAEVSVGTMSVTAAADGTFTLRGLLPGRYRASAIVSAAAGGPAGWTLRSAMVNGRDAADVPFEVSGAGFGGLTITFTDRTTELTGSVQDAAGKAAPDYFLVAFPEDRDLWGAPRRAAQARPASDGRFTMRTLRPGRYLLAAVTSLEPAGLTDPEFLETLVAGAIRVTLMEGESTVQNIRVGRTP
jgi:protocatechuate 3,4-dioxygenase beta subunit